MPAEKRKKEKIMECKKDENKFDCTCTAMSCSNRGVCCDCVRYHREKDEIPGCFFPAGAERSYDRSIANFVRVNGGKYQHKEGL